jgi:hypothetical protein
MALTMVEALRSITMPDPTTAGVIKTYAKEAPVLDKLRFGTAVGGKVSLNRWKTLPTAGFRPIGTEFTASTGETEQISEDMKLSGGRVEIDRAIVRRTGPASVVTQEQMQIIALARKWNETFYKGDGTSNSFTGLQARITGDQLINNGVAALDLGKLDDMILAMRGSDKWLVMGTGMISRIWAKSRTQSNVNFVPGNFGESPSTYNGIPIIAAGEKADESEILDFSETSSTTSIYGLSFEDGIGVMGSQTAPVETILDNPQKVDGSYVIEWDSNFQINTKRAAYRIDGITDTAIA